MSLVPVFLFSSVVVVSCGLLSPPLRAVFCFVCSGYRLFVYREYHVICYLLSYGGMGGVCPCVMLGGVSPCVMLGGILTRATSYPVLISAVAGSL